jgi:hypothetical protein
MTTFSISPYRPEERDAMATTTIRKTSDLRIDPVGYKALLLKRWPGISFYPSSFIFELKAVADRLARVMWLNATAIICGYGADGRRVKQTVGSTVTNYLWDEASTYGDVVLETNRSGGTLASYVLGGTGLISQTSGTTTSYFLQDGQSSTRALASSLGAVTDNYSSTAFGELFNSSG